MLPGVPRIWIRILEVLSLIQNGTKVTYGVDTISGVEELATNEDNRCLGKCNRGRVSKDRVGTV